MAESQVPGSPREVNLEHRVKSQVLQAVEQMEAGNGDSAQYYTLFDSAQVCCELVQLASLVALSCSLSRRGTSAYTTTSGNRSACPYAVEGIAFCIAQAPRVGKKPDPDTPYWVQAIILRLLSTDVWPRYQKMVNEASHSDGDPKAHVFQAVCLLVAHIL